MWYLYILECGNGTYYTGVTGNLKRRFQEHVSGKGGWYTKSSNPKRIVYIEHFDEELKAYDRERQIKGWSKLKKLVLIKGDIEELKRLSKKRK
jgi:putative endonuclease